MIVHFEEEGLKIIRDLYGEPEFMNFKEQESSCDNSFKGMLNRFFWTKQEAFEAAIDFCNSFGEFFSIAEGDPFDENYPDECWAIVERPLLGSLKRT